MPLEPADDLHRGYAWTRLEEQVKWYDGKSAADKRAYAGLKIMQLIAAALVPVMASVHAAVWVKWTAGRQQIQHAEQTPRSEGRKR